MKFRAKSVLKLPVEKKTRYLVDAATVSDTVAARALVNYHLGRQRPMMGDFLDALGVAHEEGLIKEETVVKPESEKLRAAVEQIAGEVSGRRRRAVLLDAGVAGPGDVGRAGGAAADSGA